jgi:hypothetical protein
LRRRFRNRSGGCSKIDGTFPEHWRGIFTKKNTKDTARQSRNQIRISKSEIRNNSENPNAVNSKPAADEAPVLGCFLLHFRLFEFVSSATFSV